MVRETPRTTTPTPMIQDMPGSSLHAMMKPPTIVMGAPMSMVRLVWTMVWICCTSLVVRVSREEAPTSRTSVVEKDRARSKRSARRSRAMEVATRTPNRMAVSWVAAWMRANTSMRVPERQMAGMSPTMTPSSMMRALRVGR